jgi:glycosyltransferase involved in cell wall biosynthesis
MSGTPFRDLAVVLVGPLPPPPGGMAIQTLLLAEALRAEGARVEIVAFNSPYRPAWIGRIRIVRAGFRLVPYVWRLWRVLRAADLVHVMANSGRSWYLFVLPALRVAAWRRCRNVVDYRGGQAKAFFARSWRWLERDFRRVTVVVASEYLHAIFGHYGIDAVMVPNLLDERNFPAAMLADPLDPRSPCLLVTRNLEAIYAIHNAILAAALLTARYPRLKLVIAGDGAERSRLEALARARLAPEAVEFTGFVDRPGITQLYRRATVYVNCSEVDNCPNSVIEALAAGIPVVSTNVGGIPDLIVDGEQGLLVAPGDPRALAEAIARILEDSALRARLVARGRERTEAFRWQHVREALARAYERAV